MPCEVSESRRALWLTPSSRRAWRSLCRRRTLCSGPVTTMRPARTRRTFSPTTCCCRSATLSPPTCWQCVVVGGSRGFVGVSLSNVHSTPGWWCTTAARRPRMACRSRQPQPRQQSWQGRRPPRELHRRRRHRRQRTSLRRTRRWPVGATTLCSPRLATTAPYAAVSGNAQLARPGR